MHLPKPSRTVVKIVARSASHVALVGASTAAISAAVDPKTESAEDHVELAGFALGTVIWWKTTGLVDNAVDKVADFRLNRKAAKIADMPVVE